MIECPWCRAPAVAYDGGRLCPEHLRFWLDRSPPLVALDDRGAEYRVGPKPWRKWFDAAGNYLGVRSARTSPDVVQSNPQSKE